MKQIPLAIGFEPARTFENFLPGPNGEAVAHLLALSPGAPPIYLWGPPGSGKTHLLHAAVHRALQQGQHAGWFSAADATPWTAEDRAVIVFDDCDAFDASQQHAAFALFAAAAGQQTTVLAAGHLPPVDLPVREDLRTRLGWGHVFALAPLGEAETRAALRREADRRGTFFSDEVMDYLLSHFARDLKHLMAELDRLDEYSLATKRAVTVPLLKQMHAEAEAP